MEETSTLSWDQVTELNVQVLVNGGNKTGDWMKHWLMIQNFTALNKMYRNWDANDLQDLMIGKRHKQIDYIIIKRGHLEYNKDAEANDMIHMGSDHRCVMATFVITTLKEDGLR